jgi:Beta-propeller repeat/Abnormal spindle-like microcephaly-assoc'd, ASPM-SPD-2-Hydin
MMSVRVCFLLFVSGLTMAQSNPVPFTKQPLATGLPNGVSQPDTAARGRTVESYGTLPLSFEANRGQTDARVKFLSRGSGYSLFLTSDEAVFSLRSSKAKTASDKSAHALPARQPGELAATRAVLRMKLVKANPAAKIAGEDELPGKSNYFVGNDPKKWRSDVPTFGKVKYEGVYPGIDLVYYGNQRQLEYDFVVAPGADPHRIQLDLRGAKSIARDEQGDLVLQTGVGEVRWHKPVAYQEKDGTRQLVAARYAVTNTHEVRFEVARYDARRVLYIDPLIYSTYLGGSGHDDGLGIAVDNSGDAYVTGITNSTNFPTMNPLQQTYGGDDDAFVSKLNASGSALIYSTYVGGTGYDQGNSIAVDSSGNAYLTGYTTSTDFPTMNPLQPAYGGTIDTFVTEINPTGTALVYSTYLGGNGQDIGQGIAVDSSGSAYVTGLTGSTNFPTMNPLQAANGGGNYDAFVTKINSSGSALVYSTYLGGTESDKGFAIAVDSAGNAYVAGFTASRDFPTMNPLQPANGGLSDAFVTEINSSGSALVYSTYLGGSGYDQALGIAVDGSGNAYVTGTTLSTNFPTMNALQTKYGGNNDAFVAKLNSSGSALVYSTYLGGGGEDYGYGIAVDNVGNAYVTGATDSANFPTENPSQPTCVDSGGSCSGDAFVSKINPLGSALLYSTYLGGSGAELGSGIAVDDSGDGYVTGTTTSTDFPTINPLQPTYGGSYDAFVFKINTNPSPAISLVPTNLSFGNQTVRVKSTQRNSTLTNTGDGVLTITSIKITGTNSGDFTETNNCPASLASRTSCTITVTFTPSTTGTRTGAVSITDNAVKNPQSLPLTGVGVLPAITLSPTSVTFPTQVVYTTSAAKEVTLKNTGLGVANIEIAVTGPFSQKHSCGTAVNPGGGCTISVTFEPKAMGGLTGSLTVTDNATNSPQKVTLTGTGTYIKLAPTSINFGNQPEGSKSLAKQITLTNAGATAVVITSIAITGTDAGDFAQTHTCGTSVASGASCFIKVTFTPSTTGARSAQVSISDNGGGSPQKVNLTGTGTP